jgi:uncharacterized protein with HEPN domain
MTYRDRQRLSDAAAMAAIHSYDIPWREIARLRDHLAHRYFDTSHALLQSTVDHDLPELGRAIDQLRSRTQERGLSES